MLTSEVRVARLWNTPAMLEATPLAPGHYRVILAIDGEAGIHGLTEPQILRAHELFLVDGTMPFVVENSVLWARMEWHLHFLRSRT